MSLEGEVELTAVTDLPRMRPLDQFVELFAPLEDSKLRAPLAAYLAPVLNSFHMREHFRKATTQLQSELERARGINRWLNSELEHIRNAQGQ